MSRAALTKEQTDAYLERIGMAERELPSEEYLSRLMWAHLTHVPFENLTPFLLRQTPSLDPGDLYDKIVAHRRGGYCYELNGLFRELLASLGFDCFCVGVCILRRDVNREHQIVHRGIIADLGGKRFYADVGYGGPCPVTPVLMDGSVGWQQSGSRWYRYAERDGYSFIEMKDAETERPLFRFLLDPLEADDFSEPNALAASGPHFGGEYVADIFTDDGYVSLNGMQFKESTDSVSVERTVTPDEIPDLMERYFGIKMDGIQA